MGSETLDQLREIVEKFENGTYILDKNAITHGSSSEIRLMSRRFPKILSDFKMGLATLDMDSTTKNILGIPENSGFQYKFEQFYECVMMAKANDLIINKPLVSELEKYQKENIDLKTEINIKNSTIHQQESIINTYVEQIKSILKLHPTFAKYFGIQEGEIE